MRLAQLIEGYNISHWQRWWINGDTKEKIDIPQGEEHNDFFLNSKDSFLTHDDFDRVRPRNGDYLDGMLHAAYTRGWVAVLMDNNTKRLMGRGSSLMTIRKALATLVNSMPVSGLVIELEHLNGKFDSHQISGDDVYRFIDRGVMPRKVAA